MRASTPLAAKARAPFARGSSTGLRIEHAAASTMARRCGSAHRYFTSSILTTRIESSPIIPTPGAYHFLLTSLRFSGVVSCT